MSILNEPCWYTVLDGFMTNEECFSEKWIDLFSVNIVCYGLPNQEVYLAGNTSFFSSCWILPVVNGTIHVSLSSGKGIFTGTLVGSLAI